MVIIKTKADDVRIQAVSPEFMVGGGAAAAWARVGKKIIKVIAQIENGKTLKNFFSLITFQSSLHQSQI